MVFMMRGKERTEEKVAGEGWKGDGKGEETRLEETRQYESRVR